MDSPIDALNVPSRAALAVGSHLVNANPRNITKKQDFCSFHMRYSFAFFIVFACWATEALAVSCNDFPRVMKSNLAELNRLTLRYDSVSHNETEPCRFGRKEVYPFIEKAISQVNLYRSCKIHGYTARNFVTNAQAALEDFETEFKRDCK